MIAGPTSRTRRRGSAYVLVLMISLIVSVVGLSALTLARIDARIASRDRDMAEARLLATSGLELMLLWIEFAMEYDDWREWFTSGEPLPALSSGRGVMTWRLIDDDGDLADDPLDAVEVVVTATVGRATQHLRAELRPGPGDDGIDALASALHAGDDILIGAGAELIADGLISARRDILIEDATVTAELAATGEIVLDGGTFTGTMEEGVPVANMPPGDAMHYYLAMATPIDIEDIPDATISSVVISPFRNPYGDELNQEGIYYIDCDDADLVIRRSRIVGTLILRSPGPGSIIEGSMNWQPAIENYPALLVEGDLAIDFAAAALSESDATAPDHIANFNPVGTPYQGNADPDILDVYPSVMAGLVDVTGDLTVRGDTTVEGVLIAGGRIIVESGARMTVLHDDLLLTLAPPGFEYPSGPLKLHPNSIALVVDSGFGPAIDTD